MHLASSRSLLVTLVLCFLVPPAPHSCPIHICSTSPPSLLPLHSPPLAGKPLSWPPPRQDHVSSLPPQDHTKVPPQPDHGAPHASSHHLIRLLTPPDPPPYTTLSTSSQYLAYLPTPPGPPAHTTWPTAGPLTCTVSHTSPAVT